MEDMCVYTIVLIFWYGGVGGLKIYKLSRLKYLGDVCFSD